MTTDTHGIRCMLMRGGTSKGAYFLAADLPSDAAERDDLLLRVMGSPDPRQIDGLGGAHPLTSKVAVVSPSPDGAADVDYLFLQVVPDQPIVSDTQSEVWIPDHDFDDHEAEAIQWLQVIAAQLARIADAVEASTIGVKAEQ